MSKLQDFQLKSLAGDEDLLQATTGKVVLAVNVASKCGLTPQYQGLEKLYGELSGQEFTVVGFPCNQFGAQEPGTPEDILEFCRTVYSVTFPLSEKIDVNGDGQHLLYAWLTAEDGGFPGDIEWNFEKFLIDRTGGVVKRYPPATPPDDPGLLQDISDLL
jgi:glutathione peroxidase